MTLNVPILQSDILIVDDTSANLQLLERMLKKSGFKVRPVSDGHLALRACEQTLPDLILLDVCMPGLDGYAVLSRLKSNPATQNIPVMFITALGETRDKVRGFQAGAVDFITKPIDIEEVESRVRTHLDLQRQRTELKRSNDRLRELEKLRDDLTHMIVHDMRSPLLGLKLAFEILEPSPSAENAEDAEIHREGKRAATTLIEMVNQMLDLSRLESGQLELKKRPCDVASLIHETVNSFRLLAGSRELSVQAPDPLVARIDSDLIGRVLGNLVGNAIKFTPPNGRITVRARETLGGLSVEVADTGTGIAPEHHRRIFEKFGQVTGGQERRGTGLGLTFAMMAVEAHGGSIGVKSAVGAGSTFWFTLPATP